MRAIDVMVRDVVTVHPDMDVAEAIKLLAENDVSANTRGQNMGGRNRQTVHVGRGDGPGRNQLRSCTLTIGQMRLADFLADRNDDALPTDHRAESHCNGDRDLDPSRDEFRGIVQRLLVGIQIATSPFDSSLSLSFIKLRRASSARYMSLRVLPTAAAGIFANEPYSLTCLSMSWISTARDG